MTARAGANVPLGVPGVMVWPTPRVDPALRVIVHAHRAVRRPCLAPDTCDIALPGHLRLLMTVHAEGLNPVAAVAIWAVLSSSNGVLKGPVVGVVLQRLLNTIVAIEAELRLVAVLTIPIVHLGGHAVVF